MCFNDLFTYIFQTLGLRHIVELNLEKNSIQSVGLNAFSGLTKLKTIDLSDNRLHSIPSGVFQRIPSLIIVILHGNPLSYLKTTEPFLHSSSIQVSESINYNKYEEVCNKYDHCRDIHCKKFILVT